MRTIVIGTSVLVVMALIGVGVETGRRSPANGSAAVDAAPATASSTSSVPTTSAGAAPEHGSVPGRIVALGDSITYNADSWFRQACGPDGFLPDCVNSGIRGNTTAQMLARLEPDVLAHRPATVLLMGGTNDLRSDVPAQVVLRRLDTIVDRVSASGARVVLCTILPRDKFAGQALALNVAIRGYADRNDVPLLDLYDTVGTEQGTFRAGLSEDGVHPNRRGADLMTAKTRALLPGLLTGS